jgi:hypothetical protein
MKTLWTRVSGYENPSHLVLRVIAAWENLRLRATSHEDDKFICLAATCAVGRKERKMIEDLLSYPPEQRMKAWIQTQSVVPAGLLFVPGPKYTEKGFLWVPTGVWREPLVDKDFVVREQSSNELVFRKPGFILHSARCSLDAFHISDQVSSLRYIVIPERSTIGAAASMPASQSCGQLAIVMMHMVGERKSDDDLYQETGALLGNVCQVEDKIYGDFICRVEVKPFTEEQSDGAEMILAQPVGENQAWIIG